MTPARLRVGVDLGGTKTVAGLVTPDGTVVDWVEAPTPGRDGPDAVLRTIVALVDRLDPKRRADAVGVGTAGVVDSGTGRVVASTDALRGWTGTYVGPVLAAATGRPVAVVGDVVAFLLGELSHGAACGAHHAVAVTAGTGVGGALAADGQVITGYRHVAGHLGHVPSPLAVGRPCGCGRTGHLESVASGPAMSAAYHAATGTPVPDLRAVSARAAAGDEVAAQVLREGGLALGLAVAGLVATVAPEVVVLGGGVILGVSPFTAAVREAFAESVLPALADIPLVTSALGPLAAVIGSARALQADTIGVGRG